MKVAIINYGMGNLNSVRRSFEEIGADAVIANHPSALYEVDRIVLPGVGAFAEGMAHLNQGGWVTAPVSYTHLDVYKRQLIAMPNMRLQYVMPLQPCILLALP